MRAISAAAAVALILAAIAPARAADLPKPVLKAPPPAYGRFWAAAEYLNWSTKGDRLPPLVTTGPPGTPQAQAGGLVAPGTSVLFGDGIVNDRWRSGARVSGGYWFDPQRTQGVEANFFVLDRNSTDFTASSNGNPILARPFVDATTGLPNSALIAFPGSATGSVAITDRSRLLGAGAAYRMEICGSCALGSVSGLLGYRFLHLHDRLVMGETTAPVGSIFPAGTTLTSTDQFDTTNAFHGLDLGLTGDIAGGPWKLTWLAKAAIGGTFSATDISGATVTTVPGVGPATTAGGLLALPTNIGSRDSSRFAVARELAANVSYQINGNLRAFAGYSVLYWTGLVRPGGVIDSTINPSQLSGQPLVGPARPQAQFNTTDYWAQGFNVGLAYSPAPDLPAKPILKAPSPARGVFWAAAEYLNWSTKGDRLPPLVTTGPLAQPGVLGAPGTLVLFGDGAINERWRSGARVSAGYWSDPLGTQGIEANFFMLDRNSTDFAASSNGNPLLARPFVDATTGLQNSAVIASPGSATGSVAINDTSRLLGAGAAYRTEICGSCALGSVSGLLGYRFLRLRDRLVIGETTAPVGFPAGTTFTSTDQFDTTNAFHGLDLGLTGDIVRGPWKLTWLAKAAIGGTLSTTNITGTTVVTIPGASPATTAGGLYALPTNIGSRDSSRFAVAPELAANLSYQINGNLRAFAGYSVLYWTGLVRPGGAIDSTINPSQLSGQSLVGPARPQAQFNATDYWAQGFNLGLAYSTAPDLPAKPILKAPPPAYGRFWAAAEYLNWSTKGDRLPPLVTTSPQGTPQAQAGVLGAPGTSVLFGDGAANDRWRSGARVSAGYWSDPQRTQGIEANFFVLDRNSTDFAAGSNGNPILARPFVDATTGLPNSALIAFPGSATGSVAINDTSRLLGAGAAYRTEICGGCVLGSVSGLLGYRFLHLHDSLVMGETTAPVSFVFPAGTTLTSTDQFDTTNTFRGIDLGLTGDIAGGPWKLTWLAKVAIGSTFSTIDITGTTVTTIPGVGPAATAGGLLALPTNIGSRDSSRFAVAPELAANVSYQIDGNLRAFAGYSLLYWTGLVRPGGTIDSTINPSQLSGQPLVGPARPQAQFNTTDYWAQGFNLGLAYSY